jgi:site-specific DNA recombinase
MAIIRQKAIDPSRVAIYIRWSTDDQGDGTTLDVQMEGCRHYILSQGWAYAEDLVFIDEGYSGGSLQRPAVQKLRTAVKAGRVDCVVVFKLDRLSRSVVDTVQLVLEEWDGLCHVKSAREPIDTTNHAGKMFFYMLVSYAEWERAVIKERTFSGKLKRAEEGKNPGFKPPYGYRLDAGVGVFAIEPAEAAVVKRIYDMYRRGSGMISITYKLNGEGIRFRDGKLWNESTVKKMLQNPLYCGDLQYGRRSRNPNRGKRDGEEFYLQQEPSVVTRDAVPAIVSREEWLAVQATRHARTGAGQGQSGRAFSSRHLLTGIARCVCGAAITGYKGGGKTDYYYRCADNRKKGKEACACGYIRQALVDEIVLAKLQEEYGSKLIQERHANQARAEAQARMKAAQEGLVGAHKALAKLEEAEARIRRLFREQKLTLAEFREQRADMDQEGRQLREQVGQLERVIAQTEATSAVRAQEEEIAGLVEDIRNRPAEQQKQVLRQFVSSIRLFRRQGSHEVLCEMQWKWTEGRGDEGQEVAVTVAESSSSTS